MKLQPKLDVVCSATLGGSSDEYRYSLRRVWSQRGPLCCWIMLNPSTADSMLDDPTLAKVQGFSRMWGYGGCIVVNLFAYRTPSPVSMMNAADPVGPDNDTYICEAVSEASIVVCAWGKDGAFRGRGPAVLAMVQAAGAIPFALKLNKDGSPQHPLYIPYSTPAFRMAA